MVHNDPRRPDAQSGQRGDVYGRLKMRAKTLGQSGNHSGERQMRRMPSAIALAMLSVFAVGGGSTVAIAAPARVDMALPAAFEAVFMSNQFPSGAGSALSTIRLPVGPGGILSTQFKGRPPGEMWTLDLYDQGTCTAVRHVVARLPSVRIGSNGGRTGKVALTVSMRRAIVESFDTPRAMILRLSNGPYHTCRRYFPIPAAR